jgi:hypothetical protein
LLDCAGEICGQPTKALEQRNASRMTGGASGEQEQNVAVPAHQIALLSELASDARQLRADMNAR